MNTVHYAIGDIHGEAERLLALHKSISEFHNSFHKGQEQVRIHLGDYVDRGPDSFDVISYVMNMEKHAPFEVINLKGNHESLMQDAYARKRLGAMRTWLDNGGDMTVRSYKKHGYDKPPKAHLDWLANLPSRFVADDHNFVFVHAGIDPEAYPDEPESVRLWTRSETFFDTNMWLNPKLAYTRVIHGHTPTVNNKPDVTKDGRRINIDTGACYDGYLTAIVLAPDEPPKFLYA